MMSGRGSLGKTAAVVSIGGAVIAVAALAAWGWRKLSTLTVEYDKLAQMRKEERTGRIRAEQRLKDVLTSEQQKLGGYLFRPIGTLSTVFTTCRGTPRQGSLAPNTRGVLRLTKEIGPTSLDGLDGYSHLWLIYVFHKNTNFNKQTRTHLRAAENDRDNEEEQLKNAEGAGAGAGAGAGSAPKKKKRPRPRTFTSKIAPPALKGKKVGVFATRTPHRPNAVGLVLVKIENVRMNRREIEVSGLDCIEGTPVLDIKPYVPYAECRPDAVSPSWVSSTATVSFDVRLLPEAEEALEELVPSLCKFYKKPVDAWVAIKEVLSVNIRNAFMQAGVVAVRDPTAPREIYFDGLRVVYRPAADDPRLVLVPTVEADDRKDKERVNQVK